MILSMGLSPRGACRRYMRRYGLKERPRLATRERFDEFYDNGMFKREPEKDCRGSGQMYAILKNGRGVYCEMNFVKDDEARELVEGDTALIPKVTPAGRLG